MCLSGLHFQPCAGSEPDCNCCLSNKYTYMQLRSPEVTRVNFHLSTGLPWTKALPIVLTQVRAGVRARSNLSPFDILLGRPMNTGIGPEKRPHPSTGLCEDEMLRYCKNLSSVLSNINQQVREALPDPAQGPLHDLKPREWVVVKDLR